MKRLILLIIVLLPVTVYAQQKSFNELMTEYSATEGCTTLNISKAMFESMGVSVGADSIKAISIEKSELIPHFMGQLEPLIADMEALMSINTDGQVVDIYQRCIDGSVCELIIITTNKDECIAMLLSGKDLELHKIDSLINGN